MSEERVMMKSKIPIKAKSCIPVRIDVNKKPATVSHKTTADRNKHVSAGVTSKERLQSACRRPEISINKTLKTKQPNQVKREICTKQNFKETNRARLKVNNPSKTLGKSSNAVKASTPVPFVKTKIKVQPTKSKNAAESHPSQPDIEFVPDEISRKRILGCIDLPSAPNAMSRGQTSIYNRPSLYRINPIARPSDPCKALLKTLQSLKIKDRESVQGANWRESIQSTNWRGSLSLNRPLVNKTGLMAPDVAALKTLENINCGDWSLKQSGMQPTFGNKCFPLARKTPKMVLEEAKKRFQEQKLKEENKSVKKVTFKVLNSALGKENKCLVESKSVDIKQEKTISESLTPDLKLKKTFSKKDETPTSPPVKIPFKESQAASLLSSNLPKQPVSILKNKIFSEIDTRRGSLFCSRPMRTGFGKLRRSISFSNFPPPSPWQTSTVHGNPSNHHSEIQVQSFDPVDDLKLSDQQSSSAFLRRSISSPEFSALCSSIAAPAPFLPSTLRSEVQAFGPNALSPASRTILKLQSIQKNNIADGLRSSVSASGLRGSLFLNNNPRDVYRRSISSPDIAAFCSSVAPVLPSSLRSEVQACGANALSPASRTILKLQSIQKNNIADGLRSSVSASGLRGSFFLNNNPRDVYRRSISSPDIAALCSSVAPVLPSTPRSEVQAYGANALSPASRTILKLQSIQKNNLADKLRSSVSASGLRGSLFLTNNLREVPQSKNPKLCTPVPVSLYPRSQTADSFSPEFLCPRTSNYIVDAPIKTPLVLKNLAAREENDDLNQVRQKLIFMPPAEEKPKRPTHVHKQNKQDYSADQECSSILCRAIFPYICSQNVFNPIAKTLENGDEMHFVPVSPCP